MGLKRAQVPSGRAKVDQTWGLRRWPRSSAAGRRGYGANLKRRLEDRVCGKCLGPMRWTVRVGVCFEACVDSGMGWWDGSDEGDESDEMAVYIFFSFLWGLEWVFKRLLHISSGMAAFPCGDETARCPFF